MSQPRLHLALFFFFFNQPVSFSSNRANLFSSPSKTTGRKCSDSSRANRRIFPKSPAQPFCRKIIGLASQSLLQKLSRFGSRYGQPIGEVCDSLSLLHELPERSYYVVIQSFFLRSIEIKSWGTIGGLDSKTYTFEFSKFHPKIIRLHL